MNIKFTIFALISLVFIHVQSELLNPSQSNIHLINLRSHSQAIPQKIFAAQMHYSRIPHQYWEHRIQMAKAMGFNALSVYLMWNFHQIEKGKFDYENGDKNLIGFLQLAKKYQLMVFFRPGPYVCSEWDFGGLPVRLLSNKELVIRSNNKPFLDEVQIYFASLTSIINNYSLTNSGPIVMLQIENQYGLWDSDKTYIQALRNIWKQLKIEDIPQYYVDPFDRIQKSHWDGANIGINDGIKEEQWVKTRQMEPNGYIFGGEIYSGWMTHWGQSWQGKSIQNYTDEFNFLMTNNHSFSMYMAHGGTNFALWAGANSFTNKSYDYKPDVTSYDWDAPINEQGSPTQKYHIFRQMAKRHATWQIPQIPSSIKTIPIKNFIPSAFADLLANLPAPTFKGINQLIYFQDDRLKMWNPGFVLYHTYFLANDYVINLTVHDFALVFLNGQFVQALDRSQTKQHTLKLSQTHFVNNLVILVESMGHINYGKQMLTDFKGLINFTAQVVTKSIDKSVQITNSLKASQFTWDIYKIPIDNSILQWKNKSTTDSFPRLFRYNLTLDETGDTYLNMENWQKGYVFVNGNNLGRYWNKGPQQKLFLPGVWQKKGVNDIVVFELLSSQARFIKGDQNLFNGEQIFEYKQKRSRQYIKLPKIIESEV